MLGLLLGRHLPSQHPWPWQMQLDRFRGFDAWWIMMNHDDDMIWIDLNWFDACPRQSLHCELTDSLVTTLGCWLPAHFRQFAQSFRARWPGLAYGPAALESAKHQKKWRKSKEIMESQGKSGREPRCRTSRVVSQCVASSLCVSPVPNGPSSGHCQCPAQGRSSRQPCPEEHGCRQYCPRGGDNCLPGKFCKVAAIQDRSDRT